MADAVIEAKQGMQMVDNLPAVELEEEVLDEEFSEEL
jgi:hypothetical protein